MSGQILKVICKTFRNLTALYYEKCRLKGLVDSDNY